MKEVRGSGCLLGLCFEEDAASIKRHLFEKQIIVGASGDPKVLRLLMPITVDREHIDALCEELK